MDRIIVDFKDVRGLGNIVSPPKELSDYVPYFAVVSEATDMVAGSEFPVFKMVYDEGMVIAVSLSVSSASITVGQSVSFSATVTGDGDPLEGVTVSFKESGAVIGTSQTDSSGVASLVKSDLTVGSHSVVASYSTGVSSAVSVTVSDVPPAPVPASVDLTGTKSILSYADGESSVLTATVLDENDDPVEGVDVNLYNGSTLWDTLTTGSDGTVSKTYTSSGSGDIVFTAEVDGTLLTKTFAVEDCLKYITDFTTNWIDNGTVKYYNNYVCPNQCKVSFAFDSGLNKVRCGIGEDTGQYVTVCYVDYTYKFMYNTPTQTMHNTPISLTSSDVLSVELDNATATWFKNSNQVDTAGIPTNYTKQIRYVLANNFTPRYVKVKPL